MVIGLNRGPERLIIVEEKGGPRIAQWHGPQTRHPQRSRWPHHGAVAPGEPDATKAERRMLAGIERKLKALGFAIITHYMAEFPDL